MKTILKREVQAIVPIYTDEGANFTKVMTMGEDIIIKKSLKTVLKEICKYYHYDLKSSNIEYGSLTNLKKTPPIPLTKNLILLAVRTRVPIGKDDGAFSYINIETIERIKENIIYFKDGKKIETLSKSKTIEKNICLAKLLKDQAKNKTTMSRNTIREEIKEAEGFYSDICMEDEVSLKEDLLVIYKRLQKIEKRLFK